MESTIIEQECLDELAVEFGVQEKMIDITARAMRGELDFEPSLRERVAMLTGLPVSALQTLYDNRISLMPGAATLLATLNANATTCGLVSGGFRFFAEKIADRLGFDRFQSNDLGIADNKLDGTVTDPILGRAAKADIMRNWSKELGISPAQVLAVGDGSNDLAMLEAAGMGLRFGPSPPCRCRTLHGGAWRPDGTLYLQGYPNRTLSKVDRSLARDLRRQINDDIANAGARCHQQQHFFHAIACGVIDRFDNFRCAFGFALFHLGDDVAGPQALFSCMAVRGYFEQHRALDLGVNLKPLA